MRRSFVLVSMPGRVSLISVTNMMIALMVNVTDLLIVNIASVQLTLLTMLTLQVFS